VSRSELSFGYLTWRGLNPVGRAATVLLIIVGLWCLLYLILPWEPLSLIQPREPSVAHYVVLVMLMMIDIPLAWTAWKKLKSDRGRRALVAIFVIFLFFLLFEARLALQRDERWRPQLVPAIMYTLIFVQLGLGRKRPSPSGTPAPAESRPVSESFEGRTGL